MNNNRNWRVVTLISISFFIYLIFSILSFAFDIKWEPFEKVNLITDVFDKNKKSELAEKRLAICSTCSYKTKLCGQDICDLCGCVLDAKVRVEDEQCYNNKW